MNLLSQNQTRFYAMILAALIIGGAGVGVYFLFIAPPSETSDTIRIGITYPETGSGAENGRWMWEAAHLAMREINDAGGILGKNISLHFADDEYKVEVGVSAAERLITLDNVDVMCGGYSSSISLAIMDIVAEYKVPWVIAASVSTSIPEKIASDPEKYKYVFKFVSNGSAYGIIKAEWLQYLASEGVWDPTAKTYSLVLQDDDYGRDLGEAFDTSIGPLGWTKVSEHLVANDESDYYAILTDIKSDDPDLVVSVQTSVPAAVAFVKQYREVNVTSVLVPDLTPSRPDYVPLAGNDTVHELPWIYFPVLNPDVPEAATFMTAYEAMWHRLPVTAAADQYSSIIIMADAIERAGSLDPDAIVTALEATDMNGPLGRYVFSSNHECLAGSLYQIGAVSQIINGTSYFIFPEEIQERQFVIPSWATG